MRRYLSGRQDVVDAAEQSSKLLNWWSEVYAKQDYFDQVIEINLSKLEPHITVLLLRIEVLLFQNEEEAAANGW
jgi:aconitase A